MFNKKQNNDNGNIFIITTYLLLQHIYYYNIFIITTYLLLQHFSYYKFFQQHVDIQEFFGEITLINTYCVASLKTT